MPKKLKAGFYSLSCCEGCEIVMFDLEENFLKTLNFVEIVEARLFDGKHPTEKLDIAIVEGCVESDADKKHLLEIRDRCKYLVAFGACATIVGIPGIRNALPKEVQKKLNRKAIVPVKEKALPLSAFVKVDALLQGCPAFTHEIVDVLVKIYHGIVPSLEEVPVCNECKERENPCLLFEGVPCLGPVTYAGCKALCPSEKAQCIGCRGFTKDGNFKALRKKFQEMGASEKEIQNLFTYFNQDPFAKKKEEK